jgi:hypothetical protein
MRSLTLPALIAAALAAPALAQPLPTAFTYQGHLTSAGSPAAGAHDFQFVLYDAATGGAQIGPTLCADNVTVADGVFTVSLDFGNQYTGQRYLEVRARQDTGQDCSAPAGFTTLAPRQPITAAPAASFALSAPAAGLTGLLPDARLSANIPRLNADNQFLGTNLFSGFTGVNRASPLTGAEVFGLQNHPAQSGYVGMYINSTAPTGLPFYGYGVNNQYAWTMLDANGAWHVFNNSYGLSVTNTGNVGIGTTTPATRLHVAGTASAADFTYTAPQTSYYMVSQAAFSARDGTPVAHTVSTGGAWPNSPTSNGLAAPVNLPHGSTITAITYYVFDGYSNADLNLSLTYQSGTGSGFTQAALAATTGTNPNIQTLAVTGLNIPIDNSIYGYQIVVFPTATWSTFNMTIKAVRIEYTLPRPAR